jgi:hypothetical protein
VVNGDEVNAIYTTFAVATSGVGTYAITASVTGADAGNYAVTVVPGALTVTTAPLNIQPTEVVVAPGLVSSAVLTGSVTGLVNGESIMVSYATTATDASSYGAYAITADCTDPANASILANYSVTATTGTLWVVRPATDVSALTLRDGLRGQMYLNNGLWMEAMPDFSAMTAAAEDVMTNMGSLEMLPGQTRTDAYGLQYKGYVVVSKPGYYEFSTTSDDGSNLLVDDVLVVGNDGLHGTETQTGGAYLAAGAHPVVVNYSEWYGGQVLSVGATTTTGGTIVWKTGGYHAATELPADVQPGLLGGLYVGDGNLLDAVPDFSQMSISAQEVMTDMTALGALSGQSETNDYALEYTGYVQVPEAGYYTFSTTSDDGSIMTVDGVQVVWNDGLHGEETQSGGLWLEAGAHPVVIGYIQWYGGATLRVAATTASGASVTWWTQPAVFYYEAATLPTGVQSGLLGSLYIGDGSLLAGVPDFSQMTASTQEVMSDMTALGALPDQVETDDYALRYTGYVQVPEAGYYIFSTTSDDGSLMWVDGVQIVSNDGLHEEATQSGGIWLKAGAHPVEVGFFEWYGVAILRVEATTASGAEVTWWTEPAPAPVVQTAVN